MSKIIICVDGSDYSVNVCDLSLWAQKKLKSDISILHVASPHDESASKRDLSGAIGVGARNNILEYLVKIDEKHGKEEREKGRLILDKAREYLVNKVGGKVETIHLRGFVPEIIAQMQDAADLIVIGKKGEKNQDLEKIGSNLEKIARSTNKPLLIASKQIKTIERFLIAFDGSENGQKIIDYATSNPLLQDLKCDLLMIAEQGSEDEISLKKAEIQLSNSGLKVQSYLKQGKFVEDVVKKHILEHSINLLVIGAYGHSKIRSFIIGSTTSELIKKSAIPLLLLR
ncbi:MAG: nucleotide-binding universal stress UspA family protein [Rickettsiales bacterium]|jgi:nucleotide-binding universal stress UspA family protein